MYLSIYGAGSFRLSLAYLIQKKIKVGFSRKDLNLHWAEIICQFEEEWLSCCKVELHNFIQYSMPPEFTVWQWVLDI